jgi:hypothetical protein
MVVHAPADLRERERAAASRRGTPDRASIHEPGAGVAYPRALSPESVLRLQRLAGNRAVTSLLQVQRAVGFEYEIPAWHVQHIDDKSKLIKGIKDEPLVTGPKYWLSPDDDGKRSDIEFVTGKLASKGDVDSTMGAMKAVAADLKANDKGIFPATTLDEHGLTHPNAEFVPGANLTASVQATIGVPLQQMPGLYKLLAGSDYDTAVTKAEKVLKRAAGAGLIGAAAGKAAPIPREEMSGALVGFLMLLIDYIWSNFAGDAEKRPHEEFAKGPINILAKTEFDKILKLVPEWQLMTEEDKASGGLVMKDEWVDWIVQAAIPATASKKGKAGPVLGSEFGITVGYEKGTMKPQYEEGEAYTVDVTRGAWLKEMPSRDILSEQSDPAKLQGFGALHEKMDRFKVVAGRISDEILKKSAPIVEAPLEVSEDGDIANEGESSEGTGSESSKGKGKEVKGKEPARPSLTSAKDDETGAPLFELRHLTGSSGGPDTWAGSAGKVWDLYQQVLHWAPPAEESEESSSETAEESPRRTTPSRPTATEEADIVVLPTKVKKKNIFVRFFQGLAACFTGQ